MFLLFLRQIILLEHKTFSRIIYVCNSQVYRLVSFFCPKFWMSIDCSAARQTNYIEISVIKQHFQKTLLELEEQRRGKRICTSGCVKLTGTVLEVYVDNLYTKTTNNNKPLKYFQNCCCKLNSAFECHRMMISAHCLIENDIKWASQKCNFQNRRKRSLKLIQTVNERS